MECALHNLYRKFGNSGYSSVYQKLWKPLNSVNPTIVDNKVFAEKLSNGKTAENDRRNDRNLLILVLKDTWHYEKDWENTHIFVWLLFSFWG